MNCRGKQESNNASRWYQRKHGISIGLNSPISNRRSKTPNWTGATQAPSQAISTTMLYSTLPSLAERSLQFHSFDAKYINNLCAGDRQTQEHFSSYFTELLRLKLRSKLHSPHAIEDVCQETFARVFTVLRKDGLREPERLGAFVNTTCNHVLFEQYRQSGRSESLDQEGAPEPAAKGASALDAAASQQLTQKVREILLD